MAKEFSRSRRVGEQIQRELASLLQFEIADPRLTGITVTAVEVSRDFSYAKVFYSFFGEGRDRDGVQKALEGAAGLLRRELGHKLTTRATPKLSFHYDNSIEDGNRLSSLINKAVAEDQNNPSED